MAPPRRARGRARLALVVPVAVAVALQLPVATGATLVQLLPDLRMARPTDIHITTSATGRRLLRLTTTIANVGRGPFSLTASRPSSNSTVMTVRQRIWRDDGTTRYITTRGQARFAGDGHDHWHIRRVATYELIDARGRQVRADSKVGFCFFDTGIYNRSTPGFRPVARFFAAGCGGRTSVRATMGISVGWGDTYGARLAYQWIDVTGVTAGTYWLIVTADKANLYLESNDANNCSWARVRLGSGGSSVTTLQRGQGCVPPGVTPSPTPGPSASPSPSGSAGPSVGPSAGPSAGPGPSGAP